jgi:low affinity Fe/Cu permease
MRAPGVPAPSGAFRSRPRGVVEAGGRRPAARQDQRTTVNEIFSRLAQWASRHSGRAHTFMLAIALVLVWGATGPVFHFSDTWQLVINTGTTIVTFLMVFLIQNTQTRDTQAIQLKLDELIRATQGAKNSLMALEDLSEEQLQRVKASFSEMAGRGRGIPAELREARQDLQDAGKEIEEAESRIARAEAQASPPQG